MSEMTYKGYVIRQALHPTNVNPNRLTWDIIDGDKVKKTNISTIEVAKHVIDVMIKYNYWEWK